MDNYEKEMERQHYLDEIDHYISLSENADGAGI